MSTEEAGELNSGLTPAGADPDYLASTENNGSPPPFLPPAKATDHIQLHTRLAKVLGLPEDLPSLQHVFSTVASLCDPLTQPEENEHSILSLDCISDLVIAISYSNLTYSKSSLSRRSSLVTSEAASTGTKDTTTAGDDTVLNPELQSLKFDLLLAYFTILQAILGGLNCDDELKLRYVNNDEDHWFQNLTEWTPTITDDHEMKLCYSMACVLLVSIYKLFKPESGKPDHGYNLSTNPYLHYFIKTWKCQTNVILLGLEIDRRLEATNLVESEQEYVTPLIVHATLKGASAIRYVVTWILNQNPTALHDDDDGPQDDSEPSPQVDMDASTISDSDYDMKCESLINFVHPLARKNINGGALLIDMRLVVIALLITNVGLPMAHKAPEDHSARSIGHWEMERRENQAKPIAELGDILIDLEYEDRFDEDIRYIFELEYEEDEWEDEEVEETSADEQRVSNAELERFGKPGQKTIPDGSKQEKMYSQIGAEDNSERLSAQVSTAVRSNETLDIDENGRDWRDIPRSANAEFRPWFMETLQRFNNLSVKEKEDPDEFFTTWKTFEACMDFLVLQCIEGNDAEAESTEKNIGQSVLNTIAKAVKDEMDGITTDDETKINPDKIYNYWSSFATEEEVATTQDNNKLIIPIFGITKFELLLHNNRKLAGCMLDEMLMCSGYRRVLIWFITHNINLCPALINYVFELLVGLRGGNGARQKPYVHSRMGQKIFLSEIEELMLLHEFLSNSGFYLLATKDGVETFYGYKIVLLESIAKKYLTLMCLMIDQLINTGVINLKAKKREDDMYDYTYNLQFFLITWISKLPEARRLFFRIKKARGESEDGGEEDDNTGHGKPEADLFSRQEYNSFINKIADMTMSEINDHLIGNERDFRLIKNYTARLEKHIKWLLCHNVKEEDFVKVAVGPKSSLQTVQHDFQFFLENFNILSKIDYMAESLFRKLEKNLQSGLIFESLEFSHDVEQTSRNGHTSSVTIGESILADESMFDESEFNDQFLDGVGHFSAGTAVSPAQNELSGKKRKNKKKKKDRRR